MVFTPEELQKARVQIEKTMNLLQGIANTINLYERGTWPTWEFNKVYKLTETDKRKIETQILVKLKAELRKEAAKILK